MSQKTSRKGVLNEEKEKTDTPVKDMKKKMAANAEKEKAAEKSETQEKPVDQQDKTKQPEKAVEKTPTKEDKKAEKSDKAEKEKKSDKPVEKKGEKPVEKKNEKPVEKKSDKPVEKKVEVEKPKEDTKADKSKRQKQNGHNGTESTSNGDVVVEVNGNGVGTDAEMNGRVSAELDYDLFVPDEDEVYPELTYDDSEDSFEPCADAAPSRSFTRRSQAKATRTPETPRPASAKHDATEDSKESKVLKLKDDSISTDRKLRSADSPKPESKKEKREEREKMEEGKEEGGEKEKDKMEVEVVVEIEGEEGARKTDTNYSKSRVKVSPYRRSMRLADQTTSSVTANYTGNNTTMEMDITETSSFITEDPSLDDSYLSGLRSIRGRRSYKPLKEMTLRNITANKSMRSNTSLPGDQPARPTGTVVGRKRKPDADESVELAAEATDVDQLLHGKRLRLLDRIAQPFRRTTTTTTAAVARRAADIVGINTDLPLSAPVSSPDTFDPECLKAGPAPPAAPAAPSPADRDTKRCSIM